MIKNQRRQKSVKITAIQRSAFDFDQATGRSGLLQQSMMSRFKKAFNAQIDQGVVFGVNSSKTKKFKN